jgi:hypothetical protein
MQDYLKMNGNVIKQPDTGLVYKFETTYREDATRSMAGKLYAEPLFTVYQLGYTATHVSLGEMTQILTAIATGRSFLLHYFSPYHGIWKDNYFRVGQGDLSIGSLEENGEYYDELSFNMTGDDPL